MPELGSWDVELKLGKDVLLSTALLTWGWQDRAEENNKLDTSACCFMKLGGHTLPQIKVQVLVTKPD